MQDSYFIHSFLNNQPGLYHEGFNFERQFSCPVACSCLTWQTPYWITCGVQGIHLLQLRLSFASSVSSAPHPSAGLLCMLGKCFSECGVGYSAEDGLCVGNDLSIHLFIYPSIYHISIHLSIYLSSHPSIHPSVHLSIIYPFSHLFIYHLHIHLSLFSIRYTPIRPSIY